MPNSPHLDLTLLVSSQAQKEVTANEALIRLEALQNTGVKDKDLATPPGNPADGDVYIVGASATGDWAGQENAIAYFDQIWRFITPNEGIHLFVLDENATYRFDGTDWVRTDEARARGTVQLAAGTATVASSLVDSNSIIFLTSNFDGPTGSPGVLRVSARNDGVDFTITSSSATDTSYVGWVLF